NFILAVEITLRRGWLGRKPRLMPRSGYDQMLAKHTSLAPKTFIEVTSTMMERWQNWRLLVELCRMILTSSSWRVTSRADRVRTMRDCEILNGRLIWIRAISTRCSRLRSATIACDAIPRRLLFWIGR